MNKDEPEALPTEKMKKPEEKHTILNPEYSPAWACSLMLILLIAGFLFLVLKQFGIF